jgi:hypothetical protein
MPKVARLLTTLSPPRTHSTIRAQFRPFQANHRNMTSRAANSRPMTTPAISVDRMKSSPSEVSTPGAFRVCWTSESKLENTTIDPIRLRTRLAMNAPMPARTANGRSIGRGAP